MRVIILVILFSIPSQFLFCQEPNMNGELAKYWFYRWRLRNDFMVMGTEAGQSLIIESRNMESTPQVHWADATIMHGYYLTMLATEHRILQELGRTEDLKNNERELYFAIKAYERLDYNSETFYSSNTNVGTTFPDNAWNVNDTPLPGCVNGYVFRDDVPPTFIAGDPNANLISTPTPNYYSLNNGKTGVQYGPMFYNTGDYEGLWKFCQPDENVPPSNYLVPPTLSDPHLPIINHKEGNDHGCYGLGEQSQDQIIRLLLGFQMIAWSIPNFDISIDTDKDGLNDAVMNFVLEAKRHATNLIGRAAGYFKGTFQFDVNTNMYWPAESQFVPSAPFWTIRGPRHKFTSLGSTITHYLPPIQTISQQLFTNQNDLGILTQYYARAGISYYFSPGFELSWNSGTIGYASSGNAKMTILLNILSNTGNLSTHSMGRHIFEKSRGEIGDPDKHFDWHPFYVPLYDYIWGWNPSSNGDQDRKQECYDHAKIMMSNAPCIGPYNMSNNPTYYGTTNQLESDGFPDYWNTAMLWDNKRKEWSNDYTTVHGATGFFSGIDYMMLYNLIYANETDERPMYHDLINRIVDYPINSDNTANLLEYSGTGYLIGAFEDLKLRSSISGSNPIEFKALDFAQLEDGAFIDPSSTGSVFIYTDPITCDAIGATNSNTPYSINQCMSCGLEAAIGTSVAPIRTNAIKSFKNDQQIYIRDDNPSFQSENELHAAVFPNPTENEFQITVNEELLSISLFNTQGEKIKDFSTKEQTHSIIELTKGMYWLEIINLNNVKYVVKIVKN